MMKPHWRCPRCDCGNYNVLDNKLGNIECKQCGLTTSVTEGESKC